MTMKQLSGSDNIFLFQEQKNVFNHVAMMMIFDVSTAPQGKVRFKDILKHFDDRMYLHPIFRRRLASMQKCHVRLKRNRWFPFAASWICRASNIFEE